MKRTLGLLVVLLSVTATAADHGSSASEALETFQRIVEPSDSAGGFYALEMSKIRDFSPDVPMAVDAECLRFAIVTGARDKPMCRRHADINKLLIIRKKEGDSFALAHPGDHEIVVFYKGIGKLIVLDVIEEDIDPFIDAVRALSPSLKKVNDRRRGARR